MLFKKSREPVQTYDVTKKIMKTWWGGTKLVPTTKAEQRRMKKEILRQDPYAAVLDSRGIMEKNLEWIDRVEEYDAFLND